MKSAISQTVSKWVEEESHQKTLALKVTRKNDPWQNMSEEEIEDRREFIKCYMQKDFELLLLIPIQPRENDFWFSSHEEFLESPFNTHDFQKDRKPFDKYGYRIKKVIEHMKDLAILHSCISQPEGRENIQKRYKLIIENEFRSQILELVEKVNNTEDKEKKAEIIKKIVELICRIYQCKTFWERYSPYF
jgi:hypothetical protein